MSTPLDILIIDDNPDDIALFQTHLRTAKDRQFRISEANSGAAGLAACGRDGYHPWCVLLDLHLPDMDGVEVLGGMQGTSEGVPYPVLILTGSGSESGRAREALHAGAQDFIGKSWITPNALLRAVDNSVERFAMSAKLRKQRLDLESREAQFKALADNTPDGITRFDLGLRHLYVNPAVERITGLPAAQFQNRTNRDLGLPAEYCELWESKLRHVIEARDRLAFEYAFDGAIGRRVYEARLTPEFEPDGRVASVLAVATDITDRKSLEDALRTADRQKDEFLAMLGHELRNPLAPILNAIAVLREGGQVSLKATPLVDLIGRQVDHLVQLVDDLLDVARVTRGKITLTRQPVSLRDIVDRAVEIARPLVDTRRHSLALDLPASPPWVNGDTTRLVQVVMNLLNNAAKYTDPGGDILLTVRDEGGQAVVRVRDTGLGIAEHMLPRVFDLFTQVDATLDRAQGGLGLGLPLVRRLVEMHGGSVEANSRGPGTGSEFTVRLPLHKRPGAPTPPPIHPERGSRCRVLVIDDNQDAADSMAMVLTFRGYQVRTAYDGTTGLGLAKEFEPDAVLLDIGLPGLSGYDVARQLKSGSGPHPLVVAVTGYSTHDARMRSQEAGCDAHLTKPVDLSALVKTLDATIGSTSAT